MVCQLYQTARDSSCPLSPGPWASSLHRKHQGPFCCGRSIDALKDSCLIRGSHDDAAADGTGSDEESGGSLKDIVDDVDEQQDTGEAVASDADSAEKENPGIVVFSDNESDFSTVYARRPVYPCQRCIHSLREEDTVSQTSV
jgi:hypothetical protein